MLLLDYPIQNYSPGFGKLRGYPTLCGGGYPDPDTYLCKTLTESGWEPAKQHLQESKSFPASVQIGEDGFMVSGGVTAFENKCVKCFDVGFRSESWHPLHHPRLNRRHRDQWECH